MNNVRDRIREIVAKLNWLSQDQDLAYASDKRKEEIRQYHNGEVDKVTDQIFALFPKVINEEEIRIFNKGEIMAGKKKVDIHIPDCLTGFCIKCGKKKFTYGKLCKELSSGKNKDTK